MTSPFLEVSQSQIGKTYTLRLYMAGIYEDARRILAQYCAKNGDCFAITPTDYVYSGGIESGFVVTLISYPRFPRSPDELGAVMNEVANLLMEELGQGSYTIEAPEGTKFISRRK